MCASRVNEVPLVRIRRVLLIQERIMVIIVVPATRPHGLKRKKKGKKRSRVYDRLTGSLEHQTPCPFPSLSRYPTPSCNFVVLHEPAPPRLPTHRVNPQYALCALTLPQYDGLLVCLFFSFLCLCSCLRFFGSAHVGRPRGENAGFVGVPSVLGFATRCSRSGGREESGVP